LHHDNFENQRNQFATLNSIKLSKSKFDYFSYMGIMVIIATVYYILFDRDKFLANMQVPINLTVWILLISYPLIRYFFPFHVYRLDSNGVTLKNGEYLKWSDIQSMDIYDNYEDEKDNDTPIFRVEINVVTFDDKKRIINLSNYTISNPELKEKLKPLINKNFKMKDAIVKIFNSFYEKHKNSLQQ
jgi:hypothetical protein